MAKMIQEMLENIVKALVEHPDEVVVNMIEGDSTVVFEVKVHEDDTGKIIGKKGRTINALRTIIRSSATAGSKKVIMELV